MTVSGRPVVYFAHALSTDIPLAPSGSVAVAFAHWGMNEYRENCSSFTEVGEQGGGLPSAGPYPGSLGGPWGKVGLERPGELLGGGVALAAAGTTDASPIRLIAPRTAAHPLRIPPMRRSS